MEKKSFLLGYSQIANWFLSWMLFNFTCTVSVSVYRDAVAGYHGISPAPLLDAVTYYGFISLVFYFLVPKMIERLGAKRLLVVGAIIGGVSFALIPVSSNTVFIGAMIIVSNLASALYCSVTTMVMVSRWFPRTKGTVMGIITAAGIGSNGVCLPIFSAILTKVGIHAAMYTFGGLLILYGIVSIFWVKDSPEEVGLMPDNRPMSDEERKQLSANESTSTNWTYKKLFKNVRFWMVSLGWGLNLFSVTGVVMVAVTHMVGRGVGFEAVIATMSAMGIASFCFSFGSGIIDDKFGVMKASWIIIGMQILGVGIAAFYGGASSAILILMYCLLGSSAGANNNLFSSHVLTLYGRNGYPLAYAAFLAIVNFTKSFSTYIDARSLEWTGNYTAAFIIFFVVGVVGLIIITAVGTTPIPEPDSSDTLSAVAVD